MINKPELLAPAGDLEKLKVAFHYGADAVYIGGQSFGLRAKSKNFDLDEMAEGIRFAHNLGKRVYVTANIFAHNEDIDRVSDYFLELEKIGADALIISDPGVFSLARECVPNMEIHISTQANNTNFASAKFWHSLGAKRIVLARELSFAEISRIRAELPKEFELEAFVHGAMCISYSGRCLLSNYMTGRDANHGECAQPCRWKYNLVEESRPNEYMPIYEDERGTYIYNSKDLCLIEYVPELIKSGIGSFKIEGRMKTPYYVGCMTKAYREAIDDYFEDAEKYNAKKNYYLEEVKKASHRDYTTGFYQSKPKADAQLYSTSSYIRTYDFIAIVVDYDSETGYATVEQRNKFVVGDTVEIFPAKGSGFTQEVAELINKYGMKVSAAPHAQEILKIKLDQPVQKFDMIRKMM